MLRTRICSFESDPRGFVSATMSHGAEIEGCDAREALEVTWTAAGEQRTRVLVDMRLIRSETREAQQEFVSDYSATVCSAVAIVIGSPVSRVIGNFFLRLNKHQVPTKLFTDADAAVDWLLTNNA
ncbi:MAG: hypothetical protein JRH11_22645 [Deltaproteobacteria bacterium]|nr:hypothetical protein [Deltaproteobacteria bacterium]